MIEEQKGLINIDRIEKKLDGWFNKYKKLKKKRKKKKSKTKPRNTLVK
jgi:murein endopeptidase